MTDRLRLGLNLGYWVRPGDASALVLAAERLGYESVWTAESWGIGRADPAGVVRRADQPDQAGHLGDPDQCPYPGRDGHGRGDA